MYKPPAETLYGWVLGAYANLFHVLKKYGKSRIDLERACEDVASGFISSSRMSSATRIPSRYKTVKDVIEDVVSRI